MDQARLRQTSHNMIRANGRRGELRRMGSNARACWVSVIEYTATERIGKALNPTDRKALVSPFKRVGMDTDQTLLDPPPGVEDLLVTFDADGNEFERLR